MACGSRWYPSQPLGNERFHAKIEGMTGKRREARPQDRPRLESDVARDAIEGQGNLGIVKVFRGWPL